VYKQRWLAKQDPERRREYARTYWRRRLARDPCFRLGHSLRKRLNRAIQRGQKAGSAVRDLGCSIEEFKLHLESQFAPGMSWENYGEWELDHIIPLATVDLSDRQAFLRVAHHTNLRPLWMRDNRSRPKAG
jgi:hypothetical protein